MRNRMMFLALTALLGVMPAAVAAGDAAVPTDRKLEIQLQLGFMGRVSGGEGPTSTDDHILTGDFGFHKPISDRTSLGLGIRAGGSGPSVRYGLRGSWRRKLSATSRFYVQLSPGVYVGGEKGYQRFPGGFLEAELGFTNYLALAAVVEVMPYTWYAYDYYNGWTGEESGTAVSWYVGAKGGQWPVVLVAIAAALISQIEIESPGL